MPLLRTRLEKLWCKHGSLILGIYLAVEGLGQMMIQCLTFWTTTKVFTVVDVLFYIPTRNTYGFQFLCLLANARYSICHPDYKRPSGCEVIAHCAVCFYFFLYLPLECIRGSCQPALIDSSLI